MRRILLVTALLLVALPVGLAAQNPGGTAPPATPDKSPSDKPSAPTSRITVNVNVVNVLMTVTDKKNRLVLDLTRDDFRLLEDDKPQKISYFSRESNLPLRIGILIDTSNSIRDRLRFEQEAAIDFLNSTVRPGKDLAFVVGFDVQPVMAQDYTDDMDKLSTAIRSLQAGGVTSLYDAIYFACKERMLFFPPPEPYLRRAMIVVSDGQDNTSEYSREDALAMAQRAEVTIYAISTNRSGAPGRGDKVLRYLADQTGGFSGNLSRTPQPVQPGLCFLEHRPRRNVPQHRHRTPGERPARAREVGILRALSLKPGAGFQVIGNNGTRVAQLRARNRGELLSPAFRNSYFGIHHSGFPDTWRLKPGI